jgi:hypothetical protein
MGRFFGSGDPPVPLEPEVQARLDGWIAMLDVDLDLAQRTLRLPVRELPPLPGEEPPPPPVGLRGAYARRAAKGR